MAVDELVIVNDGTLEEPSYSLVADGEFWHDTASLDSMLRWIAEIQDHQPVGRVILDPSVWELLPG